VCAVDREDERVCAICVYPCECVYGGVLWRARRRYLVLRQDVSHFNIGHSHAYTNKARATQVMLARASTTYLTCSQSPKPLSDTRETSMLRGREGSLQQWEQTVGANSGSWYKLNQIWILVQNSGWVKLGTKVDIASDPIHQTVEVNSGNADTYTLSESLVSNHKSTDSTVHAEASTQPHTQNVNGRTGTSLKSILLSSTYKHIKCLLAT